MESLRWVIGSLLVAIGIIAICYGVLRIYVSIREQKNISGILFGGTPWLFLGLWILPVEFPRLVLLALIFDIDFWVTSIGLPYALIRERLRY